ncbi:hypothetical protein, conserved [Plasmodium gonderi]|uniref:Uncharacterized protein n=1 Tax=Plasmodium gonderi TaxID=77519 RepID=A0A1Y1JSP6_PLAGO|nr:hypothetical protein, conserved [Plasmodium gonderi]GAW83822.1 hypothetical protein, conserved [Plasmodium gonderi]
MGSVTFQIRLFFMLAVLLLPWNLFNNMPKAFVEGTLKILPTNDLIDGIIVHLPYRFIKYKVQSPGIYLNTNFEDINSAINFIEIQKKLSNVHCNLSKEKGEIIHGDDNILRTNNCVLFINIKYKDNLKNIYEFMNYLYLNTSASALIFICDNFLYENEIYNPHEELNTTILHSSLLTYLVPYDAMLNYQEKDNYHLYTFELYWGISNKSDIVHINYHLDFGKYFNYTFFLYMKNFLLDLKERIAYEINFSIHKNFTIDPRFCFIRDSSYCISKPDYMNSNVVREVVEQQVRSLCIYEMTAIKVEHFAESVEEVNSLSIQNPINQMRPNDVEKVRDKELKDVSSKKLDDTRENGKNYAKYTKENNYNPEGKELRFSEKFIYYINALFDFDFEKKLCSNGSNDLTKKCSEKILAYLNVPVHEVNKCFLKNFHTYMKNMIKTKFYVYSIQINGNTYKIKLNKDISTKLICSAFKNMPKRCTDYFAGGIYGTSLVRKKSKEKELFAFYILLLLVLSHMLGTLLNYL